jgi:flagellar biosynthesis protein FliP
LPDCPQGHHEKHVPVPAEVMLPAFALFVIASAFAFAVGAVLGVPFAGIDLLSIAVAMRLTSSVARR